MQFSCKSTKVVKYILHQRSLKLCSSHLIDVCLRFLFFFSVVLFFLFFMHHKLLMNGDITQRTKTQCRCAAGCARRNTGMLLVFDIPPFSVVSLPFFLLSTHTHTHTYARCTGIFSSFYFLCFYLLMIV